MGLSIADIDNWNPESISAVGAASTTRANVAAQASSSLQNLSAFNSWQGASADAAQARTQKLADGLDQHGQTASTVATATKTAASEVRQIKNQLSALRSTLGQYGIMVDATSSRAVPVTDLSSLPAARRALIERITGMGQQSLNSIRLAADLTDAHLTDAMRRTDGTTPERDGFDLDIQFVRAQGIVGEDVPAGRSGIDCANLTLTVIQATGATVAAYTAYTVLGGGGSQGRHCK